MAEMSEKEIEELLARFEKTDSLDDLEFLASNMQLLSGISNPKFADRIRAIYSRVETFCKQQAEAALASNEPLSKNEDYPEALWYADYAKILKASELKEHQELGADLLEKAEQELAAYDKENGLDSIDENTPYAENYERLNDQIKPFEELPDDEIFANFAEDLDQETTLDVINVARMEVLSELAASGQDLSVEEINDRIIERAQILIAETRITYGMNNADVIQSFEKTIDNEIEKLKQGEKVAELPENPDLLTFTHYAMTYIEDEGEKSLPDTEQYKKILEETLNDPEVLRDPEKLAALKYLTQHYQTFGLNASDKVILRAQKRLNQGALYMSACAVMGKHIGQVQYNSTRVAQITNSIVPLSLQKSIAEFEAKHPLVKVAKNFVIRRGLTMASSAFMGPFGPLVVSTYYAGKALKTYKENYMRQNGGSSEGWVKSLFKKENLASTIMIASSPIISAMTFGGADMFATAFVGAGFGLGNGGLSIKQQIQKNRENKRRQEDFEKKLAAIRTDHLKNDEKKILQTITQKEIADPSKMTPEQKSVWAKISQQESAPLVKEAQEIDKNKKNIRKGLLLAAVSITAAVGGGIIGYEASQQGLFNGNDGNNGLEGKPTQGLEGSEGAPAPSESSQGNETPDQSQGNEGTTPQSQDGAIPVHNPENLINSIDDKQLKFAANALAVSNKPGLVGMNNILKDIGYEGKIPSTSREMLNLLRSGNLNEQQQHALTDFIKENTYLDANGQPHLTKGTSWNAFYENRWAEHQAEIRAARESSPVSAAPQSETLTETPTTPDAHNPDAESYEVRHQNSDDFIAQETQTTPLYANDPVLQQSNRMIFGTKDAPAVDLSSKHPSSAYEQTDSNGYTVRHIDEFKNAKFIDESKDGVADAIKAGRMLKSSEVTLSPEGNVLETSETTYGRALNGETYVKDEVVTSYDGDRVCQTNTHNSLDGRKTVTSTEFAPGTTDKPMSVTKELYHKGQSEPYQTQTAQYDEFTGQRLSLKTVNNETGKETIQSLANPKEIYQERAKVLSQWQKELNTMDRSSSEYTALSQRTARLVEAQKLTTAKAAPYLAHVGGRS